MSLALADELFFMTYDLQKGKPRIPDGPLGIGLASALLAELVFSGCLVVDGGQVHVGEYPPPAERLGEALFEQTRERLDGGQVTLREWLSGYRKTIPELVADRMVRAGDLRREEQRRLGRTVVRFFPTKPGEAFIRAQRLPSYLRNRVEVTMADVVLATIVSVLAPGGGGLMELDAPSREHLESLVPLLPLPLREMLSATESTVVAALRNQH